MDERIARFRRQVGECFSSKPGRGAPYPHELRAEAVSIARDRLARGEALSSVAGGLGVGLLLVLASLARLPNPPQ